MAYLLKGDSHTAVIALTKALALDAEQDAVDFEGVLYEDRAQAYYNLGDYEKGWEDLKQAVALGWAPHPHLVEKLEQVTGKKLKTRNR